jgi:hypothetical protein
MKTDQLKREREVNINASHNQVGFFLQVHAFYTGVISSFVVEPENLSLLISKSVITHDPEPTACTCHPLYVLHTTFQVMALEDVSQSMFVRFLLRPSVLSPTQCKLRDPTVLTILDNMK